MVEIRCGNFDIRAIADSGQCFRLDELGQGRFFLVALGRGLEIWALEDGRYGFGCDSEDFERVWLPYFDLGRDYGAVMARIPAEDAFLTRAAVYGQGIRILRQDAWEVLITFIISQRKNIPAIKRSVDLLCRCFGARLEGGDGAWFAFPEPERLADSSDAALGACGLGYRLPYVRAAARAVACGDVDLERWRLLSDEALLDALMTLPGVGPKVAHCVMLFGFARTAAFPRDVWINRIIEQEYGGQFDVERYGDCAGIIQQYMFHYARARAAGKAV